MTDLDYELGTIVDDYVKLIEPILPLAKRAYGSRSIDSPQHEASRQYTQYIVDFMAAGGNMTELAKALDVTYAGMRRRYKTAELTPSAHRARPKIAQSVYEAAVERILTAKATGIPYLYHSALYHEYNQGLSLGKIATMMGLSSANPLYYGVSRIRLEREGKTGDTQ